jgi:hypothetical protein
MSTTAVFEFLRTCFVEAGAPNVSYPIQTAQFNPDVKTRHYGLVIDEEMITGSNQGLKSNLINALRTELQAHPRVHKTEFNATVIDQAGLAVPLVQYKVDWVFYLY